MKVAVLYSGGKDSTLAIEYCLKKGWKIEYLLSVKPSRTDCYLFHFATVEHTPKIAEILNLKHYLLRCNVADPIKEALIIRNFVKDHKVDAIVLGGVGLQLTQIKSVQDVLLPFGIEVFATHSGEDEELLMDDMVSRGYKIFITEVAADGLNEDWLGKELTKENLLELKQKSIKYGFNYLGEGGHYNSLVVDAPFFSKKLEISKFEKVMDTKYSGYLTINETKIVEKALI